MRINVVFVKMKVVFVKNEGCFANTNEDSFANINEGGVAY